jgi:tRNA-specific 2-thiouridylase
MDVFFREYRAGRTPNPDVLCNREIKFGLFLKEALRRDFDAIATGHYARVTKTPDGQFHLLAGLDRNKDQSYFLVTLGQAELSKTFFPIGELEKPEVRRLAREAGLPTAAKPDSQGICFIGPVNVVAFLKTQLKERTGDIVTADGQVIGQHHGLAFSTIGQRHGLKIGGSGLPYYVAKKDFSSNRLIVAHGNRDPILYARELVVHEAHWTGFVPKKPFEGLVRIRYRQALQKASVEPLDGERFRAVFHEPQRAVTPGQYAAVHLGDELIGGGVIAE